MITWSSYFGARPNRYRKRIKYGYRTAYFSGASGTLPDDWLFQVVFDYGEHSQLTPRVEEDPSWPARLDAFSKYRAGFEVRTYRLCRRMTMFHRMAELGSSPLLVRSTDLAYTEGPVASFIASITQTGYLQNTQDQSYRVVDSRTGEVPSPKSLSE